jgi:putative tricarboxylic transport membrane protein
MSRTQTGAAVFLFVVGLFAAIEARKLSIGELGRPGPGLFPFYLALGLSIVALALVVRSRSAPANGHATPQLSAKTLHAEKVVATLFGLFVYTFALELLGFLFSTFALMLFLFKSVDPLTWPAAVGGALLTSALTYVVFKVWLQVSLPAGLLGL